MAEFFDTLVQVNLSASIAILFVFLARPVFRRYFGARGAYSLWLVVLVAMIAVLLPARRQYETLAPPLHAIEKEPTASSSAPVADAALPLSNAAVPISPVPETNVVRQTLLLAPREMLISIWLGGVLALAFTIFMRQRRYLHSIGDLRRETINGETVWRSEKPGIGPALVGAFRARIILPNDFEKMFDEYERSLVLEHERNHAASGDTRINFLVSVVTCLFWFNPLVHMAARRIREDQELACDAFVISRHPNARRIYGELLLKVLTRDQFIPIGCAWSAKTKGGLAQRIASLVAAQRHTARLRGALLVAILCAGFGAAAWAAQTPVRIVRTASASPGGVEMSAAAMAALSHYDVTGVDLENIAARLTVIAEDRTDIAVSWAGRENLPTPNLIVENGRLLVDGGLDLRQQQCAERYDGSGPANIPGVGALSRSDLPEIIIRGPRAIDLTVHGVVLTEVGVSAGGRIESSSCGSTHIEPSHGPLDVVLLSYGDVDIEQVFAPLQARLFGLGNMHIAGGTKADLELRGEGTITAGDFSDAVKLRLQGIGDIRVARIEGRAELDLPGAGDIDLRRVDGAINAEITGGGSITIDRVQSPKADFKIPGGGDIVIDQGTIGVLKTNLSGSGGVHFGGTADIINAEFEFSDATVYVAKAGEVNSRRNGRSTGKVTVGR